MDYQAKKTRTVSLIYGLWGMEQAMRYARTLKYWIHKDFNIEHQDTHTIEKSLRSMATDYTSTYMSR